MQQQVDHAGGPIEVPRGSGVEGYVLAVRDVLKRPRVRSVHIEMGKISFVQRLPPGEPFTPLGVDFETVMPYTIIRNGEVKELEVPQDNAAFAIARMFQRAAMDRLYPVAFVGSGQSVVWAWHESTTGIAFPGTEELYGFPFFDDPHIEDATLFLCASSERAVALIDTQRAYKVLMPERKEPRT